MQSENKVSVSASWPATSVSMRPIAELLPYAGNPRTHSPEQVVLLKRSMLEFGFTSSLLVNEEGVLIAGHGRLLAAKDRSQRNDQ